MRRINRKKQKEDVRVKSYFFVIKMMSLSALIFCFFFLLCLLFFSFLPINLGKREYYKTRRDETRRKVANRKEMSGSDLYLFDIKIGSILNLPPFFFFSNFSSKKKKGKRNSKNMI